MQPLKNTNEIPQNGLVLIDFWAVWCPSCKTLEPQIETKKVALDIGKFCEEECPTLGSN